MRAQNRFIGLDVSKQNLNNLNKKQPKGKKKKKKIAQSKSGNPPAWPARECMVT